MGFVWSVRGDSGGRRWDVLSADARLLPPLGRNQPDRAYVAELPHPFLLTEGLGGESQQVEVVGHGRAARGARVDLGVRFQVEFMGPSLESADVTCV